MVDAANLGGMEQGVHGVLGIELVEATKDLVTLRLEVGPAVHQPFGLLHGGVSALLAESAASIGASLNVPEDKAVVGIELSASHLRGMAEGTLSARATPIRIGRAVQVWRIELRDERDVLVCDAKCTVAVIDRPGG
jgi:uncharacterized protein (TIGR00369 family)